MEKRVVLVTGAVRGIGKVIARTLVADGWMVAIHDIDASLAESTARELNAAWWTDGDFTDPSAPARVVESVWTGCGRLDALVNNAALTSRGSLETADAALFDRLMRVNALAPLLLIQAAWPHFRERGAGRVVNIGSTNAYGGEPVLLPYAMSKAALMALTRNVAAAYGAQGLRINQINVGWTLSDSEYSLKLAEGLPPDWHENLPPSSAPSGSLLLPEDIAAIVRFLLADDCPRINGSVIDAEQFPVPRR